MAKQTEPQPINYKAGDRIKYKHPSHGWIDAIFEGFHTPELAPIGSK